MNPDEPLLLSLLVLDWTADGRCGKHREFLVGPIGFIRTWSNGSLTATSSRQGGFTVADILMAHVLSCIKRRVQRCRARPTQALDKPPRSLP